MKTAVIDSIDRISACGKTGCVPELAAIAGDYPGKNCEAQDELDQLAESLDLDKRTKIELSDLGTKIFMSGEEFGFRRGFRVAARLMVESLWDTDKAAAEQAET